MHFVPRLFVVLLFLILAAPRVEAQPSELVQQFESRTHTFDSFTLAYRLFVPPSYDSTRSHPLVLTFHGAGERGTNNTSQIAVHRIATAWADTRVQSLYAPFVVSPQAPSGGRWENVITSSSGTAAIRSEMSTVLDILDSLSTEFLIDPDRIYVTGLSLGGYGTFDAVYRAPTRFAGALAMSGGYSSLHAEPMASVPFWIIHGESDTVVPPRLSKQMVTAFEELGSNALYTNCAHFGCSELSSTTLEAALAARPGLIYSGYPGVGHGPWVPWYDDPRMQDWLMTQHRLHRDAITFITPSIATRVSGVITLEWETGFPTDSVEMFFSPNGADEWMQIGNRMLNSGSHEFDTNQVGDTPFGQLELILTGPDGLVFGRQKSPVLAIDNGGDTPPVVELRDFPFRSGDPFVDDSLRLAFRAGDAEDDTVSVLLQYSPDGGLTTVDVALIDIASLQMTGVDTSLDVDLKALPNGSQARFFLTAADGPGAESVVSTPIFSKQTPRFTSDFVSHDSGSGSARVTINWVNQEALTGHTYEIRIQTPEAAPKSYTVMDISDDVQVLDATAISDAEGPLFDGIRLHIRDVEKAVVDGDNSSWVAGNPSLFVNVRAPRVTLGGVSVQLVADPSDYQLTIFDTVVDTSSTLYGFDPDPLMFSVQNVTKGEPRKVLFDDKDGNGWPSAFENIYILEPDESGELVPSWWLAFINQQPTVPVSAGDIFEMYTIKPLTAEDKFTFVGTIGVGLESEERTPNGIELQQNYPNPLDAETHIIFSVDQPTTVTLELFDVMGRRVTRLFDGAVGSGPRKIRVNARGLAPGVYHYRMDTEFGSLTRAMIVID